MDTTFIEELASSAPTPGGGGASAYVGALASAAASMVGNLTVGKKKYADVEVEIVATLEDLADTRDRLLSLIDADAQAFAPLARAYGLPKSTPEEQAAKNEALQEALVGACEVPLQIMREAAHVLEACDVLARKGSRLAVSDAGVAVEFARAAVRAASLNVFINVGSIDDGARAQAYASEARAIIERTDALAEEIGNYVLREIGA